MKQEQEAVVVFFRRYNKVIFLMAGLFLFGLFGAQWYFDSKERELRLSAENSILYMRRIQTGPRW